jgi:hypothetical protein
MMKKKNELTLAAEYFRDPVQFVRKILRHRTWPMQVAILRAVRDSPRVAVKGCHASSKTFTIAEMVLWWLARWKDGIVVITGPSLTQVKEIVWGEIHKAAAGSRFPYPPANQTELRLGTGAYAIGIATNEAVRLQGFHGEHVLIIVDEAPGLRAEMWEAIEGARAGGEVRVVALGNPTIPGGVFYEAFTACRTTWKTFTIDAFDTPNLKGFTLELLRALAPDLPENDEVFRYCPWPFLVTRRWVYERFWEWGEGSSLWQSRVRGQFPTQADDALLSLAWLEAAKNRPAQDAGGELQVGIDVAGPGDDETVVVIRSGGSIIAWQAWRGQDSRGAVAAFLAPYKARIDEVNIDSAGSGYYFAAHLEDLDYDVNFVNVGSTDGVNTERFRALKDELYWGLRMRFEDGDVAGLDDDLMLSQLASIRYSHNSRGQVVIESKEDARGRGVKSPDRAEALMLAFADRTPGIMRFYKDLAENNALGYKPPNNPRPPLEEMEDDEDGDIMDIYLKERARLAALRARGR